MSKRPFDNIGNGLANNENFGIPNQLDYRYGMMPQKLSQMTQTQRGSIQPSNRSLRYHKGNLFKIVSHPIHDYTKLIKGKAYYIALGPPGDHGVIFTGIFEKLDGEAALFSHYSQLLPSVKTNIDNSTMTTRILPGYKQRALKQSIYELDLHITRGSLPNELYNHIRTFKGGRSKRRKTRNKVRKIKVK